MALKESKITTGAYIYRFAKLLARPGTIGNLRALLSARATDKRSMVDYLERNAVEKADKMAILFEDQQISWSALNVRVNRLAHFYRARGVGYGDAVAINIQNRPEVLINVLACMKLGVIAGMVNTSQVNEALAHSLKLIQPKLLLIGSESLANMDSVSDVIEANYQGKMIYVADGDNAGPPSGYEDLAPLLVDMPSENPVPDQEITLETATYYIFTSGTTGLPKASITTQMKLYRASLQFGINVMTLSDEDTYYCSLPFYHSNALLIGLGSCLISGATLAVRRKFSATAFFDDCRKFNATAFLYIGELLRYLLALPENENDRNHNVEKILGNGLRPDIWMQFKERFGINRVHEFYGASEGNTGFVNIFNFDKTVGWAPKSGSAWTVVDFDVDADTPTRDNAGFMQRMNVGETGLLISKIDEQQPFDGYTDKQETEKKILRDVFEKGDEWFNTGDLVVLQKHGHIQFGDRIGDTFRWQGENVATTEVESAVMRWPQIQDAVVYGVEVPGRDGRCGMMFVNMKPGETLDKDGLAAQLRENLPPYAVPRFLRIGSKVDVTGTFKFQKSVLKRESYDGTALEDEVFFLPPGQDDWTQIDATTKAQIDTGETRL
jgi:acyl-CoA synthetase (AMP-forming)/AMP-acid ligase II